MKSKTEIKAAIARWEERISHLHPDEENDRIVYTIYTAHIDTLKWVLEK